MERNFHAPRKLNLALVEDPLLAVAASSPAISSNTWTPTASSFPVSPLSQNDAATWFHGKYATPSLDSVMDENEAEFSNSASIVEQEATLSTPNLSLHAKVYAIAEK